MMFFWKYHPGYWDALQKHGFITENTGLRFMQSEQEHSGTPPFNTAMQSGTNLHSLVTDNRYGLLIDREFPEKAPLHSEFNPTLLAEYDDILQDKLLGAHLREWLGKTFRETPVQDNPAILINNAKFDFTHRRETAEQYIALSENSFQSYDLAFRLGARCAMAGLGKQTPFSRIQIAAARGMARAHRKPWGVYYETGNTHESKSSGLLHRRLLYYAFLAGAKFLVQENDEKNMFDNSANNTLSAYGKVVKEVFDFCRIYNYGPVLRPVALLFDPEDIPLETMFLSGKTRDFSGYPPSPKQFRLKSFFQTLFLHPSGKHIGNEWDVMTNSLLPDAFDIISSDAPIYILRQYPIIIYMGNNEKKARAKIGNFTGEWLSLIDLEATVLEIYRQLQHVFPVWVEGDVQWMINKLDNKCLLTIFNNEGDSTSDGKGQAEAIIETNSGTGNPETLQLPELASDNLSRLSRNKYSMPVPAGGLAMVEFPLD